MVSCFDEDTGKFKIYERVNACAPTLSLPIPASPYDNNRYTTIFGMVFQTL